MVNIVRTVVDLGSVIIDRGTFADGLVIFAGADIYAPGTILARQTTNLKFQLYVKGGSSNGNGVPVGVLVNESVRTGSGDNKERIMMNGEVNENRLIIDSDGDNSNIDATVKDLLRQTGLYPVDVQQLAREDNIQPTESDS